MIFTDRSASLCHYGVLGMKWGVRKDGKPQGFQYGGKNSSSVTEGPNFSNVLLQKCGSMPVESEYDRGMLRKRHESSADSDMYMANAQYNIFDEDNKGNCALDTMAYDLRRKGYAVHAGANDGDGTSIGELLMYYNNEPMVQIAETLTYPELVNGVHDYLGPERSWIDSNGNARTHTPQDMNEAVNYLNKRSCENICHTIETSNPANSRGGINLYYCPDVKRNTGGIGGHTINWELDDNNQVTFRDCQSHERMNAEEFSEKYSSIIDPCKNAHYYRLDNTNPNIDLMLEDGVICNDDDYDIHVQPSYVYYDDDTPVRMPPIPK